MQKRQWRKLSDLRTFLARKLKLSSLRIGHYHLLKETHLIFFSAFSGWFMGDKWGFQCSCSCKYEASWSRSREGKPDPAI